MLPRYHLHVLDCTSQGMSYPLPWARKVLRVENWQMPVVWMPSQLQRSSFLKGERGFAFCTDSTSSCFWALKSHQTLPWFIFLQVIRAHRQAPLARLHLGIYWPSRIYGWRQTWTSACTGQQSMVPSYWALCQSFQLDLKLINYKVLSFHIISYLVFICPKRPCRKVFFHPTQNFFSFRNYIQRWNGRELQ